MRSNQFFYLYAHNIPVQGRVRSAVYDLQRHNIVLIPNVLYSILMDLKQAPIQDVQEKYAANNPAIFGQYLDFLRKKDLGLFVDSLEGFADLNLNWHSPHGIQNAVVAHEFAHYDAAHVLRQLDGLNCRHVELRLDASHTDFAELLQLAAHLEGKVFQSVSLLLLYTPELRDEQKLADLYERSQKIQHIIVHNAPRQQRSQVRPDKIVFVAEDLRTLRPRNRHIVNLEYFTEAMAFNPYFNRKVCVDELGDIKNCLLLDQQFGNVNTDPLEAVVASDAFQALWHAAPDQTAGLQESELRYALYSADYLEKDVASGLYHVQAVPEAMASVAEPV